MKHIVFIHLLNDFSGSPKVLSQVIANCKAKGYQIDLFMGKSREGFLSDITENQYYYTYKRFNNRYLTLVSFFFSQFLLFFKLLKYRNKDVVFYINTMLPFGAGLAGKLLGKQTIYHIHETYINPVIFKKFLRFVIKQSANKIIFVSNTLRFSETFKRKEEVTVFNALPHNFLENTVNHTYCNLDFAGNFNVLMVCSLRTYKGLIEFVQIAKNCESLEHIKFILVLNAQKVEIDNFFRSESLPNNLTLVPSQSDLHPYYAMASLLLNLSKTDICVETFGLTILEALAYGVPVIVPPVGGPSEIVTNAKEGYLIDSSDTDSITQKIIELSNNPETCLELSRHAKQRALFFTEASFNQKITAALEF